jgi:hypothetical protein
MLPPRFKTTKFLGDQEDILCSFDTKSLRDFEGRYRKFHPLPLRPA